MRACNSNLLQQIYAITINVFPNLHLSERKSEDQKTSVLGTQSYQVLQTSGLVSTYVEKE